jgi:hypothetical protein
LRTWRRSALAAAVAVALAAAPVVAAEREFFDRPLRVRIACGGTEPHLWSGTVRFDDATVDDLQLLSLAADAAAGVWLEDNTLHFAPPRPRRRDAVDVTVTGAADARLVVQMQADPTAAPVTKEIALVDALRSQAYLPLDEFGNALVVERSPGDELRIDPKRDSLIFSPGEQFSFDVEPLVDGIEPSTSIDIDTTMTSARGNTTLWGHQQRLSVPVEGPAIATVHVPLPRLEGVYQIHLAVSRPAGFYDRFLPGSRNKPLVERSFQVVVLSPTPSPPVSDATWQKVLDIDPASPRWWERLPNWTQIRRLPGVAQRPLGSLRAETIDDPLGRFVRLPPTPAEDEPHWQAYPLPLPPESVGLPHLLEVEYPNDQEQHVGLSIVEPNAARQVVPIGRDSGVYVEGIGHAEQVEKHQHRLLFWPRSESPLLLVTNQHPTAAARFGHIRVLRRTSSSIATEPWASAPPTGRLVAAYLSRPLVPETFGASEGLDVAGGESVDDWQTFYESATRLADYANYAGYNAAVVSVMADGSAVFPNRRLLSTPRHNTGRIVAAARDLPEVDALELELRMFDRCGLALLPTLQFAAPLPELEALRRGSDPRTTGLELVGQAGLTWTETYGNDRGLAPYYNLLDDRVQRAMLDVVRDLVDRYGHHRSLAGLAVQLSGNGYAMLPGLEWGMDDATIARFERETGIQLPDNVPNRFAVRHALLVGEHAEAWRNWRAARVTTFYRQMAALIGTGDNQRRLLLTTEEMFAEPELAERFRPRVSAKPRIDRAMLSAGIDRAELARTPGVVVCPTRYVESMTPLVDRAFDLGINEAFAAAPKPSSGSATSAALLYHPPQRRRMESFDVKSPFNSTTRLVVQSSADGAQARRPYAAVLREQDPLVLVDGGELIPLGQEDATRHLRRLLQQLPADPPATVYRDHHVTVRSYVDGARTVLVVTNECPWSADVELTLDLPTAATGEPLSTVAGGDASRQGMQFASGRQTWPLNLKPYDVQAVRFSTASVRVEKTASTISEAGRRELTARLTDLNNRDLTAAQVYVGLENPGFEPRRGAALDGWQLLGNSLHSSAELDIGSPRDGAACMHLRNTSPADDATLQSNAFTTPPTGQLAMTVFIRGENVDPGTELRLMFEADGGRTPYRQFSILGGSRPDAQPIGDQWGYWAFRREDLPLDSRGTMRVKFVLTGPGDVWIDDVRLYDLLFPLPFYEHAEKELLVLTKLRFSADSAAESGHLSECVQLLEGYWPRFLTAYTPAVQPAIAIQQPLPPEPTPPPVDEQDPAVKVGGWWNLRRLFK